MSIQLRAEFSSYGSASPGVCWKCNLSRRKTDVVVDLDKAINEDSPLHEIHASQMGFVQLCSTCVGEMAALIGWIAPAKAETLSARLDDTSTRLAAAQSRVTAAEVALGALRAFDAQVLQWTNWSSAPPSWPASSSAIWNGAPPPRSASGS